MGKTGRPNIREITRLSIRLFTFTSTEKRELVLGTVVFVVVELSLIITPFEFLELLMSILNQPPTFLFFLLILGIFTTPLFLFHELAHKFVAQGYGMVSEFRLFPNLAFLSLFSIFLPIKLIAPGVVISRGSYNTEVDARISLAGPLVNILLGGSFLFLSAFLSLEWMSVTLYVSKFSFDLALFNLLPIFVLDGAKVFRWNSGVFGVIFGITLLLWLFHPFGILYF